MRARASAFLRGTQGPDGMWEDFDIPGEAGVSRGWATAYVAGALQEGGGAGDAVLRACEALLAAESVSGGWGYGPRAPADADSTANVLLLLARAPRVPFCEVAAASDALAPFADDGSGGFRTFVPLGADAGWLYPGSGWCLPHASVTALAGEALLAGGLRRDRRLVAAAARFLADAQGMDGSWDDYWWEGRLYPTSRTVRFLRRAGLDGPVRRAVAWVLGTVHASGGWGHADAAPDAFSTGLALNVLAAAEDRREVRVAARAGLRWLADAQRPDGGWEPAARLRVPPPDEAAPWARGARTGRPVIDQHGLFTAATALAGACAWSSWAGDVTPAPSPVAGSIASASPPMALDDLALRRIVARAAGVRERLAQPADGAVPVSAARLAAWREEAGDEAALRDRLARDGLDKAALLRALADPPPHAGPLPPWAATLAECLAEAACWPLERSARAGQDEVPFLDDGRPAPFQEVAMPLVQVARRRLRAAVPDLDALLAPAALASLDRSLLRWLTFAFGPTLLLEMHAASGHDRLAELLERSRPRPSRRRYRAFCGRLLAGGLADLFAEYPALGCLAATLVDQHVEAAAELAGRWRADRERVAALLCGGTAAGRVEALEPDLSDRHDGGRTVAALTLSSGRRVVYKPKPLALDAALGALLRSLEAEGLPLDGCVPGVLDRGTYGWTAWVSGEACADEDGVRRYYRRAGALLALLHALRATDVHQENLIAVGERPVLVDTETLLHAWPSLDRGAGDDGPAACLLERSLLRTALLPEWQPGADAAYDVSGLGGRGGAETGFRVPEWTAVNTDAMALGTRAGRTRACDNLPRLDGRAVPPDEHAGALEAGYREAAALLARRGPALLAPGGPLSGLHEVRGRFILRPTALYDEVLRRSVEPRHLRGGPEQELAVEPLAAALAADPRTSELWPLLAAEREAIRRLDVPRFLVPLGHGAVEGVDASVVAAGCLGVTALDAARRGVRREMRGGAVETQLGIVRAALHAGAAAESPVSPSPEPGEVPTAPTSAALVEAAAEVAWTIARTAHRTRDGAAWIALSDDSALGRPALRPLGHDLYHGAPGVALALAAAARATGDAALAELARSALRPLRRALRTRSGARALADRLGIGGALGAGSVVYALTVLAPLLDHDALLGDARRMAAAIDPRRIAEDGELDVTSGAAGAALGLLALHATTGDAAALEAAAVCGAHLLARRVVTPSGTRAWAAEGRTPLTGVSHGAAGIGYALERLARATGEAAFADAAREGFAFEAAHFHPATGNWADLRAAAPGGDPRFMASWCHGAPGISLTRFALGGAERLREAEAGVPATLAAGAGRLDHLCCGAFGRIETLATASAALHLPALRERALRLAGAVLERRRARGGFALLNGGPGPLPSPALFTGTGGVAYGLLRLAGVPLPSVLLWEPPPSGP